MNTCRNNLSNNKPPGSDGIPIPEGKRELLDGELPLPTDITFYAGEWLERKTSGFLMTWSGMPYSSIHYPTVRSA